MLEISQEQMEKADVKARVHFYRRLRDYVREKLPDETSQTPDSKLLAYIAEQDRIAGEHEIKTELGVTKWVCLSLDLGKDFYQKESVKNYFNAENPPDAETKLHIFVEYLTAKQNDSALKIETVIKNHGYHLVGG
jgi:hypothetical protein